MVHILKIYVAPQSGLPDIRRLAVSSDVLNSYELLVKRIISVIPKLSGKSFELCWKDDDGDDIVITNDDELAQAIANSEDGVIKMYIRFTGIDAEQKSNTTGEAHEGVVCDNCNQAVKGYRYKCLQCEDFDLCSACNASGKHPFHDMLKLASPAHYSRQWLFVGWKKLFRSAFGCEPMTEMIDRYEIRPKCPYLAGQRRPRPPMEVPLNEFMKNNNNNVNLLENLGQFVTNLLEPWGVDVKVDIDHSRKESSPSKSEEGKKEAQKDSESSENSVDKSVESEEQTPKTATAESKHTEEATAATESKCSEEIGVKPTVPESKNATEGTDASTNTGNSKREEETKPKSAFQIINEAAGSLVFGLGINGGVRPKTKDSSTGENSPPVIPEMSHGLFTRHFDESMVSEGAADGFTVITASSLNGADKKSEAGAQPTAPVNDEKVQYPVLVEELVGMNENTSSDGTQKTSPEFFFSSEVDPQVVNALNKMAAMGFSNEGGWLLRLLQTKKGNINEALDSLYPNPQRH